MADGEIARFYTRSRRFPKMIGRMTDGSRIPGGPYTLTQVGVGGTVLLGMLLTRTLWTTQAVLLDLAITAGVAWGVTWLVGLLPITRRNLFAAFLGAVAAMFKPTGGTYKGQVPKVRRPHHVVGSTRLLLPGRPDSPDAAPAPPIPEKAIERPKAPAPVPAPPRERPVLALAAAPRGSSMSAVERLLQQAKSKETS